MCEGELVSVIIPVYNREETICKAIESVLKQTYQNLEVLIINDGSTDRSEEIIKTVHDNRIRLISYRGNKGANHARNVGIKSSQGSYIAFNDSDDEWVEDKIKIQLQFMKSNNYEVSFGPYKINETGNIIPSNYMEYSIDSSKVKEKLKRANIIGTPTLMLSRKVIENVGMFDEDMPRLQDYEFGIRIAKRYEIGCCSKVLLNVSTIGERISNSNKKYDMALSQIIRKHNDFIDLSNLIGIKNMFTNETYHFDDETFKSILSDRTIRHVLLDEGIKILKDYADRNNEKNEYLNKINLRRLETDKFAIYGAGKYGQQLFDELQKINKRPKCFIVSDRRDVGFIKNGIEKKCIDDVNEKDLTIVVAVASKTQNEILKVLAEKSFQDVFTI